MRTVWNVAHLIGAPRRGDHRRLWRMLLSGDRQRIADAVRQIPDGEHDAYAVRLLSVRCRDARRDDTSYSRIYSLIYTALSRVSATYTERERRSALTAMSVMWGGLGRELCAALDFRADYFERTKAYTNLIRRRDQRAVRPLVDALLNGYAPEAWWCILTLGELGDPRAVDALIEYIQQVTTQMTEPQQSAIPDIGLDIGRTLRTLNGKYIVPPDLLTSAYPHQRAFGVFLMAGCRQLGAETASALLQDPDPGVRAAAEYGLHHMRRDVRSVR